MSIFYLGVPLCRLFRSKYCTNIPTSINFTQRVGLSAVLRGGNACFAAPLFILLPAALRGTLLLSLTQYIQNRDTILSSGKGFTLKSGEQATLQVKINVKKYAEYVMVEVPVPAGCVFKSKPNRYPYPEYFYDRVVLFYEKLNVGEEMISIPLEVRYTCNFTLNPADVKLMYDPTFFGRENLKNVTITP